MTTTQMTSTEMVQHLYAAFGRGDIATVLESIAPECQWIQKGDGIPSSGKYKGPAGVAEFFRILGETEQITRFEPKEYFANGSNVVALGYEECRVVKTGKTVGTNWSMLFRLRDNLVVYFEIFFDTEALARAFEG